MDGPHVFGPPPLPHIHRVDFRATDVENCRRILTLSVHDHFVNRLVALASSVEIRLQGQTSENAVKAYFFRYYFRESEL
jgi:hypothetical protein